MAMRAEQVEAALMDTLCSRVREDLRGEDAERAEAFVRRYYHWVPPGDLASRSAADLYGAALAHLEFAHEREPGTAKVRVYNPERERDGWESPRTVVEVVTDDMPFLVDSLGMELNRHAHGIQLFIHPVVYVERDGAGELVAVVEAGAAESFNHIEIERETDPGRLAALDRHVRRVLGDVRAAVEDWPQMRQRLHEGAEGLGPDHAEAKAFLEWVDDGNFVLLGQRAYELVDHDLRGVEGSGLGILRQSGAGQIPAGFARLPLEMRALTRRRTPLILTKANQRSTVHRPLYLDYIGVKRFAASGEVVGERRFLGLYATPVEKASPREIPVLRGKCGGVVRRAAFPPGSHDAKALADILETYPRDELFQIEEEELFDIAMGILALGERPGVRLFARRDPYERFVSCLVFLPRDRYNTDSRERIGAVLSDAFGASTVDWSVRLSASVLARIHYIVRGIEGADYDNGALEARVAAAARSWSDDLADALGGSDRARELQRRYRSAFPPAYRADWRVRAAVEDIARIEQLAEGDTVMSLHRPEDVGAAALRCKLYRRGAAIALSDVLPIFESMGARVIDERPYEVTPSRGSHAWIYDFGLSFATDVREVGERFQDAFVGVLDGRFENDRLGALVLTAGLTGREVSLLRSLAKYRRQAGTRFSDRYLRQALTAHPAIARLLVELFRARFDPESHDSAVAERLTADIERAIDEVASLDQDRILRDYLALVQGILRTNYFQSERACLSVKLDSARVPFLPSPRPQFEIFVYSPRVEGIHLRGGKVARGGLRWSDRHEDFRTEILGLMKAQMVKNAAIVPVGAKGGFVLKRPPVNREFLGEEVRACYRTFISGLLDLTDNMVGGQVVHPPDVVRYDGDDTYLVVAADKGTAALSDLANEISAGYGFWLGDAFASGGSKGYDHKEMGITARGAWEAVKRHFHELGRDIQSSDFTVVGIGDMAGDVFGNGMLLSPHIRLVGAFNHAHVFLDPDPDPETSLRERRRLFALPRSAWSDYDPALISAGGGVFPRTAKRVPLSPQARAVLDVDADELTPDELIRALLRAPVDLLWNGGVGTFVKASGESHLDVGDKTNDAVRIDAPELRCRVVGEGGNLGLTQPARIEYALAGGRINTDAIDNAGGVACSDDEVNLKILLGIAIADGTLTMKERDELLASLTDAVAERVLERVSAQALALSLESAQAGDLLELHVRLMRTFGQTGRLDRRLEHLPGDDELAERKRAGQGLTRPELSILLAYSKIGLQVALAESNVTNDQYLRTDLADSFPPALERFRDEMRRHPLQREIIATNLANGMVDRIGTTFVFRIAEETAASSSDIARAYAVTLAAFDIRGFWRDVEALDGQVDVSTRRRMLFEARRLVTRGTRWLVHNCEQPLDITAAVARFKPTAAALRDIVPGILHGPDRLRWETLAGELTGAGVGPDVAQRTAAMDALFGAFDVAEAAAASGDPDATVAQAHFAIATRLQLQWLRDRILELPRADHWQTLARGALRDDLYRYHRALTVQALGLGGPGSDVDPRIDAWAEANAAGLLRFSGTIDDIEATGDFGITTLSVAVRELGGLTRSAA